MSINTVSNKFVTRTITNTDISGTGDSKNSENSVIVGAKRYRPIEKPNVQYPEDKQLAREQIIDAIGKVNKEFIPYDRRFEISIHEKTKEIMVKVIDATNDEIIREIPSEKILDMVAAILEVTGIMIDKKI